MNSFYCYYAFFHENIFVLVAAGKRSTTDSQHYEFVHIYPKAATTTHVIFNSQQFSNITNQPKNIIDS